ncbi:hypothetical protein KP77_25200 [Jeotgalibacillus alimentarius]|uniref:Uncharacterized protein n=1 Tax=Jeotgalibacillus alimentarius TaxID=135826 RepID=A0A0C2VR81_9BACL|nr:hypothetical protein [Jeotgalibacillus alimentarius]KIL46951.1 hypothetical protein KP77_25200 [Jeotgalibacillus alimentarius]
MITEIISSEAFRYYIPLVTAILVFYLSSVRDTKYKKIQSRVDWILLSKQTSFENIFKGFEGYKNKRYYHDKLLNDKYSQYLFFYFVNEGENPGKIVKITIDSVDEHTKKTVKRFYTSRLNPKEMLAMCLGEPGLKVRSINMTYTSLMQETITRTTIYRDYFKNRWLRKKFDGMNIGNINITFKHYWFLVIPIQVYILKNNYNFLLSNIFEED